MSTAFTRLAWLALLACLPGLAVAQLAGGQVWLDENGNGRLDAGERGVPGVKLSNGRDIAITDRRGRYRIALRDGDTLFVIKPPGYRFPTGENGLPVFWRHHFPEGSQPLRYGRIEPSSAQRVDFALLADPTETDAPFEALVITDPQMADARELGYYARAIVEPAARHENLAMGLTLGDLVADALDLYPGFNEVNKALGLAWLHAPGNHDIDFDAADDAGSLTNYRRTFGPDTVAWERPGHAFIALDDVIYLPGQRPAYIGGLREDQFAFLENYLATLESGVRVVLSLHIPLFDDRGETFRHADRARLFALLERFSDPLVLSGHTHGQRHHFHGPESGWSGSAPLHEYNVGAACGGFWGGQIGEDGLPDARMADGTPNGYAIVQFGERVTTRYHASRGRDALRIAVHSPGTLRRGAYPAFPVHANVFGAEADAAVEYRINSGDWQAMRRVLEADPGLLAINADDRLAPGLRSRDRLPLARPSPHLWAGRLPTDLEAGEHRIEVRVQSRFEGEYRARGSYRLADWGD